MVDVNGVRSDTSLNKHRLLATTALAAVLNIFPATVMAQTWDGDTSTDFSTPTNWDGDDTPGAGNSVFLNDGTLERQPTIAADDSISVDTVSVSAGTLTVEGSLYVDSGLTVSDVGVVNIALGGEFAGITSINTGGKVDLGGEMNGGVTNAGTFWIYDTGVLTGNVSSSGSGSNDGEITGTLDVTGGTFTNTGTVDSATTLSGGTLNLDTGSNLSDSAAVTVSGGTLNVNGAETVGSLSITGGSANVADAGSINTSTNLISVSSGTLTTDSDAVDSGETVSVSGTGTFTSSGTDSFTAITQSGGTVNGDGVLTLSGAFTQSGGTTGGSVDINAATFTQSGGATLAAGTTVTSSGAQALQGGTIAGTLDGAGAITAASGTSSVTGAITNADSLTVSGGTVNITGAGSVDTSTNSISVSSGTLTTDSDAVAGDESISVSGTGTFTSSGTDSFTAITQSGGTVNGDGVMTLSGAFTQSSGTTGGSVDVNAATFTQSGGATLAAGTTVTSLGAQALQGGTIAGTLDGVGAITAASGTTSMTGTIAGASSLTVSGGTVNITGAGTIDTSTNSISVSSGTVTTDSDAVASGETVSVSGTGTFTSSGTDSFTAITQSGGTVNGTGVLTLSGAFTQSGGTTGGSVDINAATFTQSGGATLAAGTTVSSSGAQALQGGTVAGSLDGVGAITVNTGTTTLSSVGVISNAASVGISAGGTLAVNGTVNPSVTVNGGTLSGTGTVGGIVGTSGTVGPGNSIGTLNVSGNVNFDGSTYAVEANAAGDSDRIAASGVTTLSSASIVDVQFEPGDYTPPTTYTIITSTGGVMGMFGGVTSNAMFLMQADLQYLENSVELVLSYNIDSLGTTPNQIAVGNALNELGVDLPYLAELWGLTETEVSEALDAMSGEGYASLQAGMNSNSHYLRDAILSQLKSSRNALPVATNANGYLASEMGAATGTGVDAWIQGYGGRSTVDGNSNSAAFNSDGGGMVIGADGQFGDARLGALVSYGRSEFDISDRNMSAISDDFSAGVYGSYDWDAFYVSFGGTVTKHDVATTRAVVLPDVNDTYTAGYGALTTQAFIEAGAPIDLGATTITPFAGLGWSNTLADGFTENGSGPGALTVEPQAFNALMTTLGLRLEHQFVLSDDMLVTASASAAWRHTFADAPTTSNAFAGGTPFEVTGPSLTDDVVLVGVGIDADLSEALSMSLGYSGQLAADSSSQALTAGITGKF